MTELSALEHEIRAREWYHTIELAPGVETPGWFDLRGLVAEIPFPAALENKRCLDIGTFDGFWAFEMERRGAREVLAIDIIEPSRWDWPIGSDPAVIAQIAQRKGTGDGFEIARRELGFATERREFSVYDLDPAEVGEFDFVFLGSLLLHLRDPVLALERARSVCRGRLMVVDAIDPQIGRLQAHRPVARLDGIGRPWWWSPNPRCVQTMLEAAGLRVLEGPVHVHMPRGAGQPVRFPQNPLRLLGRSGRAQARLARRGDAHVAFVTEPA
jgi:tRNA (mo5U34)-methyltransferase